MVFPSLIVPDELKVVEVTAGLYEVRGAYEGTYNYWVKPSSLQIRSEVVKDKSLVQKVQSSD